MDMGTFSTKITLLFIVQSGMHCTCLHNVLVGCPYAVIP